MTDRADGEITQLLDRAGGDGDTGGGGGQGEVSVRTVMDRLGERSFAPLILLAALVVLSPASAVPGLSSAGALIIALLILQMAVGRTSPWLPRWIADKTIGEARLQRALSALRRPVGLVEPWLRPRLSLLVRRPGAWIAQGVCLGICVVMPPMELVPTLGSAAALAIVLITAGLLIRDGLLVLLGYLWVGCGVAIALWLLS